MQINRILTWAAVLWPTLISIVLLVIGFGYGAGIEPVVVILLVGVQMLMLALYYGLPWAAKKLGSVLSDNQEINSD